MARQVCPPLNRVLHIDSSRSYHRSRTGQAPLPFDDPKQRGNLEPIYQMIRSQAANSRLCACWSLSWTKASNLTRFAEDFSNFWSSRMDLTDLPFLATYENSFALRVVTSITQAVQEILAKVIWMTARMLIFSVAVVLLVKNISAM